MTIRFAPVPSTRPMKILRARKLPLLFITLAFFAVGCDGAEEKALPDDAPRLLREAAINCDNGNMLGCHNLAVAYWQGQFVSQNIDKAQALFQRACTAGAMLACSALEEIDPAERIDESEAAGRIKLACDNGLPAACDRWAELLKREGRDDEALAEAQRQCARTPSSSCIIAGELLDERGESEAARDAFRRACAQGIVVGCRMQAALAMREVDGEPDQDVFAWLTTACRGEDGVACVMLADLYTNGVGPREDPTYARRLRDDACAFGIEDACSTPEETQPPSDPTTEASP